MAPKISTIIKSAQSAKPDILAMNLFGRDLISCLRQVTVMGIKRHILLVVPNLSLSMSKGAGPEAMEGVVDAVPRHQDHAELAEHTDSGYIISISGSYFYYVSFQ